MIPLQKKGCCQDSFTSVFQGEGVLIGMRLHGPTPPRKLQFNSTLTTMKKLQSYFITELFCLEAFPPDLVGCR